MMCVSGQLKSFLTINVDEDADYSDLRETILKWERSHMRWNQSLVVPDDQGPSPMEVDRDGKGKNKYSQDYGKGKQNPVAKRESLARANKNFVEKAKDFPSPTSNGIVTIVGRLVICRKTVGRRVKFDRSMKPRPRHRTSQKPQMQPVRNLRRRIECWPRTFDL